MHKNQIPVFIAGALIASSNQAAPLNLSDGELSAVLSGDNSIQLQAPSTGNVQNSLAGLLGPSSLQASTLTPAQFVAAMAAIGVILPTSIYAGQSVTEILIDMAPITVQTDLSSLLTGLAQGGSQQSQSSAPTGSSMGSISINNLNATGTRVYLWSH